MEEQSLNGHVLVIGSFTIMALIFSFVLFIYLYQKKISQKQQAFQQIEALLKKQELKFAYASIEGRESERKRIAEDLHDNMGSILASLRLYSDLIKEKSTDTEMIRISTKLSELTEQTANETRRISQELSDSSIKHLGVQEPIYQLCEAITQSQKLTVKANVNIQASLATELSFNIYRIVQELLTNALKHAKATTATLELSQIGNEYVSLIFGDNGQGFDQETVRSGMGLQSLNARVERFNGTIRIESKKGAGTNTIIEIPLT
jgi:two-component system, NarL family, sensor kinase